MVSILFSTKLGRDMRQMPLANTHILGVTSAWMGIPVFYGAMQAREDWFLGVLSCTLAAVCTVSMLFWSNPVTDSWLHRADKTLCWAFAAELVWYSVRQGLDPAGLLLMIVWIVVLYLASDLCFRKGLWGMQLLSHMLFRFAFYWWVHVLMVPAERYVGAGFAILTNGYFLHALALYRGMRWESALMKAEQYWLSCAAVGCWVWLNGWLHFELNEL